PKADIEKITSLSYDGRNLLVRIPKEIVDFLQLKKGEQLKWIVNSITKEIKIEVGESAS
ncbi:MAG: hypothetical protein HY363_06125, partial [Candidatus Aenigmarchaeota archaeon]|nr:hypothetical protein [Candidatus Aenigmarchaeota archaeon]